jgi:two-component sensor histidine kinase
LSTVRTFDDLSAAAVAFEDTLALALVSASDAPIVLLDGDLTVIAASASFCRSFEIDAGETSGLSLFELGSGEWNVRQFRSLLKVIASGGRVPAYDMDLVRDGRQPRQLVVTAHKLEFGDAEIIRILVTLSDVTDARLAEKLKDDLLREKGILLQEVQHRVANSLQIVASLLTQSARHVQSDEIRAYMHDAHSRVMSIATVQKHLAAARLGDVALQPYFAQLCESLGASMIRDHDQSIVVNVDDSMAPADVSLSLALIVTELVINALKHAFPGGRAGKIKVDYLSHGPNWTLSVGDDGVGMPHDLARVTPGLGTTIIESLAKQLRARVHVAEAQPGAMVSVSHTAAVDEEATRRPFRSSSRSIPGPASAAAAE